MLNVELDEEAGLATVTPEGTLTTDGFDAIAAVIDPYIEEHGKLNGLIIYTNEFPGWESFGAALRHIKFVKNHHQKLSHIALVTDSKLGDLAENLTAHFISAAVKHFAYSELEEAKRWIVDVEKFRSLKIQDRPELLAGLSQVPKILSQFVQSIPKERLDLRRGGNFWTIAEHVSHLAEVQPMLLDRFERFVNEDHPEFVPYIPGDAEDQPDTPAQLTIADALDQFALYRRKQLTLLESVDDQIWQRNATHPEFDQYSFSILVRHTLMHDYWHMYRMEELWLTKDAYLTTT